MKTTKGWTRLFASAIAALFAFGAANTAQAANYIFCPSNPSSDSKWGTARNWYEWSDNGPLGTQQTKVPSVSNQNFTSNVENDGLNSDFKANPVVNINGNYSTTWKIHVRNLGTESNPVVFKADTDSRTITAGNTTASDKTGYYIGNSWGNAWLRLEKGKYQTSSKGGWYIGSGSTSTCQGHVIVCSGVTMGCSAELNLNNGSLVNNGGTVTAGRFFVGNASGKTGTLTLNSGTVKTTGNYSAIGNAENSTGVVTIKSGATFHNDGQTTNPNLTVGHASGSSGTLNIQGGTMRISGYIALVYNPGTVKSDLNVTDGGVLEVGYLYKRQNVSGVGTLTIDGGTIKAHADNDNFIWSTNGLEVAVGAGGATFDAAEHAITVNAPVVNASGASGALTITGGGKVTLAGGSTYTGGTTVDAGTVLKLGSAAKSAIFAHNVKVDVSSSPADNTEAIEITDGTISSEEFANVSLANNANDRYALELRESDTKVVIVDKFAGEYVWNGGSSADGWHTSGRWSKNSEPGNWYDSTAAVFETAGDAATVDSAVAAASVTFRANATVGGSATLTVPEVSVVSDVAATISAPTAGELTKTGAGTLTLGASRTADATTLSEGTLVMSGSGTTLDWTKLTFGTDVAKHVTLRFTDGATAILPNRVNVPTTSNRVVTLIKDCGDWTASDGLRFPVNAGSSATFIHNGGTLTTATYLSVGDHADATAARLEINGGTVNATASGAANTIIGSTCDATAIVRSGGILNATGGMRVGSTCAGTLTIDDGGTVNAGDIIFAYNASDRNSLVDLKQGGNLSVKRIYYNNDSATGICKFRFDGGTLKCLYQELATAHDRLYMYVTSNGGTIDVNGKTVALNEPLLEDAESTGGGMTFKGGGTITLASGNTYTGTTTVELGTTVHVAAPGEIGAGLAVAVPATAPADGVYTLLACDGEGVFTGTVLTGVVAPAGSRLLVTPDGKSVLCVYGANPGPVWIGGTSGSLIDDSNWANNAVPGAGDVAIVSSAAAATLTLPANATFSPSAIVFPADCAAVTIDGEGEISGIVAVSNLSETVSHTINVPVRFAGDIQVKQAAMAENGDLSKAHVTFAGGAYAAEGFALENGDFEPVYSRCIFGKYYLASTSANPWTAVNYNKNNRPCVADGSELHIPYAGKLTELDVGSGAKVDVGEMSLDAGRVSHHNYGEMTVTSLTVAGNTSEDTFLTYNQGTTTPSVFKFGCVTNNISSSKWFYFGDKNASSKQTLFFGAGGISFGATSTCVCFGNYNKDNTETTIRPWNSDFTIGGRGDTYAVAFDHAVVFNTDDENGTGRTITLDAATYARNSPTITVSGTGTLKVNRGSNAAQPTVTVKGTATLALKPDASLGTGATTVNGGATLAVAESGTVAFGGNLSLKDGATLRFNFTDRRDPPVLDLTGKTVTLGDQSPIAVSVNGTVRPAYGSDGKYFLTAGGNFKWIGENKETVMAVVAKTEDCANWVKEVGVDEATGNIYACVDQVGLCILFR